MAAARRTTKAPVKKKPVTRKKKEPSNFMVLRCESVIRADMTLNEAQKWIENDVCGNDAEDYQIAELKFNCESLEPRVSFLEVK